MGASQRCIHTRHSLQEETNGNPRVPMSATFQGLGISIQKLRTPYIEVHSEQCDSRESEVSTDAEEAPNLDNRSGSRLSARVVAEAMASESCFGIWSSSGEPSSVQVPEQN